MTNRTRFPAVGYGLPALAAFLVPIGLVAASLYALAMATSRGLPMDSLPLDALIKEVWSDVYVMRAIRFTLMQALLSALLSTLLAIPLARALASRPFPGRGMVLALFGAPFILPVIVAILGIVAIWGQNGLVQSTLAKFGLQSPSIYGLGGILLAHIFFNLPLAARILLQGWLAIPQEQWRLAAQLGMTSTSIARHIEWPMLRERIPGALALIFLLCVTSFTVVLALGGGPKATTIELAIYQAIRYDFDLERAALLACVQITLCAGLALSLRAFAKDHDTGQSLGTSILRTDRGSLLARGMDAGLIGFTLAFLGLPLAAAAARGIKGLILHELDYLTIAQATGRSLTVAVGACVIMLLIALPMAQVSMHLRGKSKQLLELPGFAIMIAPPIALGAGIFLLLHNHVAVDDLALPLTSILNGLQAVPFALVLLPPALAQIKRNHGRQMQHLGLEGRSALRLVYWPLMRRPVGLSLGITAALSMGDLGVIALFGSPSAPTLPLYLYQQMGAYRMDQAYGIGLLLTLCAFGFFVIFDKGLGSRDQA